MAETAGEIQKKEAESPGVRRAHKGMQDIFTAGGYNRAKR